MRAQVEKTLAFRQGAAKALPALPRQRIAADGELAAGYARPCPMPGRGPILAASLSAELPELGGRGPRKVAALTGLAPVAEDSGRREHRRVSKGGRGQVRNALDMAARASLKTGRSPLQARAAQRIAQGKRDRNNGCQRRGTSFPARHRLSARLLVPARDHAPCCPSALAALARTISAPARTNPAAAAPFEPLSAPCRRPAPHRSWRSAPGCAAAGQGPCAARRCCRSARSWRRSCRP